MESLKISVLLALCLVTMATAASLREATLMLERMLEKRQGYQCFLPADPGPCPGFFPRYYYDVNSARCEQFIFGGCEGNPNKFESHMECYDICGVKKRDEEAPILEQMLEKRTGAHCFQPVDPGPCGTYMPRFYYDASSGRCKQFTYGGCAGNSNNFENLMDCYVFCGAKKRDVEAEMLN